MSDQNMVLDNKPAFLEAVELTKHFPTKPEEGHKALVHASDAVSFTSSLWAAISQTSPAVSHVPLWLLVTSLMESFLTWAPT